MSRSTFATSSKSLLRHVGTVSSTMDVAKDLVVTKAVTPDVPFGVLADAQTKGRGTSGRSWLSASGNLFLTIGVPQACVPLTVLPVLPLMIGLSVRDSVADVVVASQRRRRRTQHKKLVNSSADDDNNDEVSWQSLARRVQLKWPNDVVFEGKKLSGVLVEQSGDFLLIGIGVNVTSAPEVVDGGRDATSVAQMLSSISSSSSSLGVVAEGNNNVTDTTAATTGEEQEEVVSPSSGLQHDGSAEDIAQRIWTRFFTMIDGGGVGVGNEGDVSAAAAAAASRKEIVRRFGEHMDWSLVLKKRDAAGTLVKAVRLNDWGHLVVSPIQSSNAATTTASTEETLCADYLL